MIGTATQPGSSKWEKKQKKQIQRAKLLPVEANCNMQPLQLQQRGMKLSQYKYTLPAGKTQVKTDD